MLADLMWVVTAASVIGVVLNNLKRRECFVIWIATNTVWMVYDWRIGARAQAAMFALYLALSICGLVMWSWKTNEKKG
jgi:nicotinamide riboside transporter PnuC